MHQHCAVGAIIAICNQSAAKTLFFHVKESSVCAPLFSSSLNTIRTRTLPYRVPPTVHLPQASPALFPLTAAMSSPAFIPPTSPFAFTASPSLPRQPRATSKHQSRRPKMSAAAGPDTNSSFAAPQDRHLHRDWRVFRAHLVAADRARLTALYHSHPSLISSPTWAHPLPAVEVGAVLLARSNHKWPRNFAHLDHAVVLVTDVTDAGVSGLLLNRPTKYTVGAHASVLARVGKAFERNLVHLGGDCSTGSLEVLHGHGPATVAGAREIAPGLYRGGFNASRALVQAGRAKSDDFHFFVAYSKWTWEQFNAEVGRGAWSVAACAPDVLLGKHLERTDESPKRFWEDVMRLLPGGK